MSMGNNGLFHSLISDILKTDDVLLSINSGGGICEARVEKGTPFKIKDRWATIGEDKGPWHIHLNVEKVKEAKFVQEPRTDGKNSYSTVSYTHLRAHETPEHLVCRLLLEKKK